MGAPRIFLLMWADPEALNNLCLILKIMSKRPSRYLVKLQGKLNLKIYVFYCCYYIFQYSSVSAINRFRWLI